LTGCAQS